MERMGTCDRSKETMETIKFNVCMCVCTHAFNDKLEEEVINLKRGVSQGEMVTHRKNWG